MFIVACNATTLAQILDNIPPPSTTQPSPNSHYSMDVRVFMAQEESFSMPETWNHAPKVLQMTSLVNGQPQFVDTSIAFIMLDPSPSVDFWFQINQGYIAVDLVDSSNEELQAIRPYFIQHLLSGAVIRLIDSFVRKRMSLVVDPETLAESLRPVDANKQKEIDNMSMPQLQAKIHGFISPQFLTLEVEMSWKSWAPPPVAFPGPSEILSSVRFFWYQSYSHCIY